MKWKTTYLLPSLYIPFRFVSLYNNYYYLYCYLYYSLYSLASFRKSTSATLSYYRHKRFSLRHIPKTAPTITTAAATAAGRARDRARASFSQLSATATATASATRTRTTDTDTDTMPLTANETDTSESAEIINNAAFIDNETCR